MFFVGSIRAHEGRAKNSEASKECPVVRERLTTGGVYAKLIEQEDQFVGQVFDLLAEWTPS